MTGPMQPLALIGTSNQVKARAIWTQAQADMSNRLWQAAIGRPETDEKNSRPAGASSGVQDLIASLIQETDVADRASQARFARPPPVTQTDSAAVTSLGPNERYRAAIESAAARASLPGDALASIVNAEAGKLKNGAWNSFSRNPRSSAAGLGQFLSGTWVDMAEKRGTWLNAQARRHGYLGAGGKVQPASRAALLAMRYDPDASIQTIADYSRGNIERLKAAGVTVGDNAKDLGRVAYMAHYMGPGDAIRFMKGQLSESRSRLLLNAQVGAAEASRRIARTGDAGLAHARWLYAHIDRNLRLAPKIPAQKA